MEAGYITKGSNNFFLDLIYNVFFNLIECIGLIDFDYLSLYLNLSLNLLNIFYIL